MAEYTEEEKIAFRREVDQRRLAGRRIDPVLTCTACGYKCNESYARQLGLTSCPTCGSTQVRVQTLEYPGVPDNPLPSVREAEMQSRSQRPWVR
jgi:rubrerythrin